MAKSTDQIELTTFSIWALALLSPTIETYRRFVKDPNRSWRRIFIQLFVGIFVVQALFFGVLFLVFSDFEMENLVNGVVNSIPRFIFINVVFMAIVWLTQYIARGREEATMLQTAYTVGAFFVPLTVMQIIFPILHPIGDVIALAAFLYLIFLDVVAIRALYSTDTPQTVLAVLPMAFYVLFMLTFN